jgi:hypothetical protein
MMREDYFRKFREKHPLPGPLKSAVDQESQSFLPPPWAGIWPTVVTFSKQ